MYPQENGKIDRYSVAYLVGRTCGLFLTAFYLELLRVFLTSESFLGLMSFRISVVHGYLTNHVCTERLFVHR